MSTSMSSQDAQPQAPGLMRELRATIAWLLHDAGKFLIGVGHHISPSDIATESELVDDYFWLGWDVGRKQGRKEATEHFAGLALAERHGSTGGAS